MFRLPWRSIHRETDRIFISYRRSDSAAYAKLVHDHVAQHFGAVFMDVEEIAYGDDFSRVIDDRISQCKIVLAIIGPKWTTAADEAGNRRLDDAKDFVRREIASAIRQRIRVIPMLVGGAAVPKKAELPEDLQRLPDFNAMTLRDTSLEQDLDTLLAAIETGKPGYTFREVLDDLREKIQLRRIASIAAPAAALVMFFLAWIQIFDLMKADTALESATMAMGDVISEPKLRDDIAIVTIHRESRNHLDKTFKDDPQSWRHEHAQLINTLAQAGAKALVLDFFMILPSPYDGELTDAIKAARERGTAVVLGAPATASRVPEVNNAANGLGVLCIGERAGLASVVPLAAIKPDGSTLPSLALIAAQPFAKISVDTNSRQIFAATEKVVKPIAYSTSERITRKQSCRALGPGDEVLQLLIQLSPLEALRAAGTRYRYEDAAANAGSFKDKMILIAAETEDDMFWVFRGLQREQRHGIELHADALNTLLNEVQIRPLTPWLQLFVMLCLGGLGAAAQVWLEKRSRRFLCFLVSVAWVAASIYFYIEYQVLLNLLYDVGALWIAYWVVGRIKARRWRKQQWSPTAGSLRPS
jgi:CHASE2 domain-containing sensor protein